MAYTTPARSVPPIHPFHAIFVAGLLPLFGGAALSLCNWNDRGVNLNRFWTGQITCTAR